jgi:hypothetical protein
MCPVSKRKVAGDRGCRRCIKKKGFVRMCSVTKRKVTGDRGCRKCIHRQRSVVFLLGRARLAQRKLRRLCMGRLGEREREKERDGLTEIGCGSE